MKTLYKAELKTTVYFMTSNKEDKQDKAKEAIRKEINNYVNEGSLEYWEVDPLIEEIDSEWKTSHPYFYEDERTCQQILEDEKKDEENRWPYSEVF